LIAEESGYGCSSNPHDTGAGPHHLLEASLLYRPVSAINAQRRKENLAKNT